MKIEHSNQINDFLMFFIETKIDGELRYETTIDYRQSIFWITDLKKRKDCKFEFNSTDEKRIVEQIKYEVEKLAAQDYNQIKEEKINPDNLKEQIKEATSQLLEMAKEYSWNKISSNVKYVIKKVDTKVFNDTNLYELNKIRRKLLEKKPKLNLNKAVEELKAEFENIYLVELYIFNSKKDRTFVEIEILEKSELDEEYRETVIENSPMLHCKIAIPPYIGFDKKEKFDINWQLRDNGNISGEYLDRD